MAKMLVAEFGTNARIVSEHLAAEQTLRVAAVESAKRTGRPQRNYSVFDPEHQAVIYLDSSAGMRKPANA